MIVQREKIRSGRKKDRRFEGEDRVAVLHWQKGARWAILSSGGIPVEGIRGESHSAGRYGISKKTETQQEGQLQE